MFLKISGIGRVFEYLEVVIMIITWFAFRRRGVGSFVVFRKLELKGGCF